MAKYALELFEGIHRGSDVWVIASGPSAGYVEKEFFCNKITIGVNRVWTRFDTNYLVVKEQNVLQDAIDTGAIVFASRHHCGTLKYAVNTADGWFVPYDHMDNELERVDLDVIGTNKIVVSYSTITSAMHIAAYLGASNIIVVGHDCGTLNGKINFDEYPRPLNDSSGFYEDFMSKIEPASIAVRDRLEQVYGCRIYSLNPFLNLGLEGAVYEHSEGSVI